MDETRIVAWLDGTLSPEEAAVVAAAVAADPDLAAIASRHRKIRARFESSFTPLLAKPAGRAKRRPAQIVSLAAAREERQARTAPPPPEPRTRTWPWLCAVVAALVAGTLAGQSLRPGGIPDREGALALSPAIDAALDRQPSGDPATVNVVMSFRDHDGKLCRNFLAQYIGGVACRAGEGWLLRYAAPVDLEHGDYRMAGGDKPSARVIATMIAGAPLDAGQERKAIADGWR